MHFRSLNEALACRANFSMSSSGTVDSSAHQSGTSQLSAFHCTHSAGWDMGSSGDISLLSSSVILDDPCKKEAMSAWSCGGSPKSESVVSDPILLGGVSADQPAVGWPQKLASCLPFPAPVFRSTTVPSFLPRAGMGFLPIQPFDLFFQSHHN